MLRSRVPVVLAVLTILSLAVSAALAQSGSSDRRSSGEGHDEGFGFLRVEAVQRDLHLTDEQRVQILALSMEIRENRGNLDKKIAEILTPEQSKRLKQICLQVGGPAVINGHEVAMKLGLTKEQRQTLKALQEEVRKDTQEAVASLKGLTIDERRAKMPELVAKIEIIRKDSTEKALAVLTPAQRNDFEAMQGVKIDFGPPSAAPAPSPKH
jgi:Spy/CpxP family protein refolding chaperone